MSATELQAGDRVSIVATDSGRRYFGTVSWVGGGQAAVWWDVTGGAWRGPVKWLRKETKGWGYDSKGGES